MKRLQNEDETGKGGNFRQESAKRSSGPALRAPSLANLRMLGACIQGAINGGAYVSFGHTSDGGAVLIRILDGPDKLSTYCGTEAELNEAMEAIAARYEDTMPNSLAVVK